MDAHSRLLELANNSEIENSRNKSHAKIFEYTVFRHMYCHKSIDKQRCISSSLLEGSPRQPSFFSISVTLDLVPKITCGPASSFGSFLSRVFSFWERDVGGTLQLGPY